MPSNQLTEPVAAIVVAAGSGVRLGEGPPKALREVAGESLVARSVRQLAAGGCDAAVIVIASGLEPEFERALVDTPIPIRLVQGGAERQDSVRAGVAGIVGLPLVGHAKIVLVHDAARAFVPAEVIARVIDAVREGADAVVPAIPVVDTIRQVVGTHTTLVDRSTLRAVQTPQGFSRIALEAAHEIVAADGVAVTDDATACEYAGYQVVLVEGASEAMKITQPLDLALAEALAIGEGS